MRRSVVHVIAFGSLLGSLVAACGAPPQHAAPVAPAAPPDPEGLVRVREAFRVFGDSPGTGKDFAILADTVAVEAEGLPPAALAETELIVALGAGRLLASHLDRLADRSDPAHDVVASGILPVAFGERVLDGESPRAYRDRLCEGPAAADCQQVLPDFFGAALAYAAGPRLVEVAKARAASCACAPRYATERDALRLTAEEAVKRAEAARAGWTLEADQLCRSAFALPEQPPGDVVVRVSLAEDGALEVAPGERFAAPRTAKDRKALEARLAGAREAAGTPGPDAAAALEVEARAPLSGDALLPFAQAAARAGFGVLRLEVRLAAPPHPRGTLRIALVDAGRAPKGLTGVKLQKKKPLQAFVDAVDAAFASAEGAKVAWTLR